MHRKLLPLALMYAENQQPIEGRTRLQKMVFLLQKELENRGKTGVVGEQYDFVPYDYGPFSKDLYADLDDMLDDHFVNDEEKLLQSGNVKYIYEIQDQGEDLVESQSEQWDEVEEIIQVAREIKDEYNDLLLSNLIEYVYSEYPGYAEKSVF